MTMSTLQVLRSLSFSLLPLCLWFLLKTLNDGPELNMKFALSYVALLGAMSVVQAVTIQHYDYLTELWGLKLKVALTGLVYKKVRSFTVYLNHGVGKLALFGMSWICDRFFLWDI